MISDLRIVVQLQALCPFAEAAAFKSPNKDRLVYMMDLSVFCNKLMFWLCPADSSSRARRYEKCHIYQSPLVSVLEIDAEY